MRILAILMAAVILAGCGNVVNDSALATVLDPLMTDHAAALAGDDVAAMRRSGRVLIATYDAARP